MGALPTWMELVNDLSQMKTLNSIISKLEHERIRQNLETI